jgi:hypothetical protein
MSTNGITMQSALQIVTKVLPGNRIEIQIPSASDGSRSRNSIRIRGDRSRVLNYCNGWISSLINIHVWLKIVFY